MANHISGNQSDSFGKSKKTARGAENEKSAWPVFLSAHAKVVELIEERLSEAQLPELAWYDVLWALEKSQQGRLRMHELAEKTVISRSNLTRLVDRLEAARLTVRDRDSVDRRGAYAVLTTKGRGLRKRMWQVYSKAIEEYFDDYFSHDEHAQLRDLLGRPLKAKPKPVRPSG